MLIRKYPIAALAATLCFATGAASPGGFTQPTPAPIGGGGGQVSEPENYETKPYEDSDLSEEAEAWRKEQGRSSTAPLSTNQEPEGGAATASSAGLELGTEDHRTEAQKQADETPEEKEERLKPAPTHFGHRIRPLGNDED